MNRRAAVVAACLLATTAAFANPAEGLRYFAEDQVPSAAEIAALLALPDDALQAQVPVSGLGGRTRGVRLIDAETTPHRLEAVAPPAQPSAQAAPLSQVNTVRNGSVVYEAPISVPSQNTAAVQYAAPRPVRVARVSSKGSVALALRFAADATQIQPQHLPQLDALAAGIKMLPAAAVVTIAGHTDAFGSALYNIDLSFKRAMAVRAYLVNFHGIPARRLVAVGKGETQPVNRANPFAPENRRVQIHAEYDLA